MKNTMTRVARLAKTRPTNRFPMSGTIRDYTQMRWFLIVCSAMLMLVTLPPSSANAQHFSDGVIIIESDGRQNIEVDVKINRSDITHKCQGIIVMRAFSGVFNAEVKPLVLQRNGVDVVRNQYEHVTGVTNKTFSTPWYSGGTDVYQAGALYSIRFQSGALITDKDWSGRFNMKCQWI